MQTTTSTNTLRRVSTHTSTTSTTTSSRITPSIHTRRSTDSRVLLEDVLADGDEIGPSRFIHDQPISVVNARSTSVPPLRVIRKLGTGSYAVVYLVQEILDADPQDSFLDIGQDSPPLTPGRYFAVKCLAKHALDQDAQLLEATIHQSLPVHPNVVTLWTTLETASYLLLVLDYVPGEDLFYFLEQARDHVEPSTEEAPAPAAEATTTPPTPTLLASLHPNQLLSHPRLKLVASMFTQMCDAVAHCHRNGVFHRDLKPENFMVTDSWSINPLTGERERKVSVKLTDFGLATRDMESGDMDCGSAPYMSYECHNNITPTYATAPADVWSLGIVLINMLYHANPWLSTAAGHCASFEYYLREPIPFFMERFPGMTPAVAEFFARRVFCLLPVPDQQQSSFTNVGRRITADEFGRWARDLALHLGPAARRTPALAFARPPSPSPPTQSRPQTPTNNNINRLATSVSQPGTRTPSPSFHARPSIPSPQPSSVETQMLDGGIIDLASDEEEEEPRSRNGTGSGSKRRKRAPRGKSQSTSQPFSPLTSTNGTGGEELTDAALYAASVLAEKMQNVAREASAIKTGKTPPASAPVPLPAAATTTVTASSSSTITASAASSLSSKPTISLNTKRSIPELRHKKSAKWVNVFRRDSGSDQDVATADEVADAFNAPSPVAVTALNAQLSIQQQQQPTATAKNIASVVLSLDSTSPPPSVHSRNGSEHGSNRGRRKTRGDRGNGGNTATTSMDSSSQRDVSPGSLMSVSTTSTGKSWGRNRSVPAAPTTPTANPERRARSKSPSSQSAISEAFNLFVRNPTPDAPPVPSVPKSFRMPPSFGPTPPLFEMPLPPTIIPADSSSRKSYAPSISSVSTSTTASSAFTAFSGKKRWTASSNSSRYSASSASVRSISTNATSVSSGSGSWRVGAGEKKAPPPLPKNVKVMDGIPWELDEMPRQMAHRPKEHKFSPEPVPKPSKNRRRPPSAPTSPTPGSSFGLEPISERPTKKSAMKQPRNANQAAFAPQQPQDSQGMLYGEQQQQASGSALEGVESFPPPKSFGAGRGMPPGSIRVNTDAANAYLSAGLAGNGMAMHSTDGITTTALPAPAEGPTVTRQPKTPISRLFNWRSKPSTTK